MRIVTQSLPACSPLKILVVDDDQLVRDLLAAILSSCRHEVVLAESGVEALEKLEVSRDFDLLLSDVNMPGMNGLELIRHVRLVDADLPIIILTGNQNIRMAIDALRSGANDYLLKTEDIEHTVVLAVDSVMEKHRLKAENARLLLDLARKSQEVERLSSYDWLQKHMNLERFARGAVLFRKDDAADKLYLLKSGKLRVVELDVLIEEGKLIGETGLFSPGRRRTATVVCETDVEIYSLAQEKIPAIISTTPSFLVEMMQVTIGRSMVNLAETTAAKEKIESELQVAKEIQLSMLPRQFPAFPDRGEIDVFATMDPAKEVGGDLYDLFPVGADKFCFIVGDVSGKGVPAALYMAITKTLLKSEALRGNDPGAILANVNGIIYPDNPELMFITVFCAILDVATGELRYANAGHNPPLLSRGGGDFEFITMKPNMVLGVMGQVAFESEKTVMGPGDVFFMYTDGVNEAMNTRHEQYDYERLKAALSRVKERGPREIVEAVNAELEAFASGEEQSDDITMLSFKFLKNMDTAPEGPPTIARP